MDDVKSLTQGKYPWGIIINSRFVKVVSSRPVTQGMIADEKAARQKNHEKQCVFHGFLLFKRQKKSIFEKWSKDKILWLLFCELSEKQDLNQR